jgi:hypothetical protein
LLLRDRWCGGAVFFWEARAVALGLRCDPLDYVMCRMTAVAMIAPLPDGFTFVVSPFN